MREASPLRDAEREQAVRELRDALGRLGPRDLAPAVVRTRRGTPAPCAARDGVAPEARDRALAARRLEGRRPSRSRSELSGGAKGSAAQREIAVRPGYDSDGTHMRTTWNGSLSFGLVIIPVGLAPATKPAARQSDVSFRLLHRECTTPIKQKRWCPTHEREVAPGRDRRGLGGDEGPVRHRRGRRPRGASSAPTTRARSRSRASSRSTEVDPVFFDRTYFLVPARGAGAAPAVRAAARGDAGDGDGRARPLRARGTRERSASSARRATRSCSRRCSSPRTSTRRPRSRRPSRRPTVKKPELELARQVIDSLVGDFEPDELDERVPPRPARAARGEAARRGDRRAGAGRGRAGDRPDGGAQGERRGGEEAPPRKPRSAREAGPRAQGAQQGQLSARG